MLLGPYEDDPPPPIFNRHLPLSKGALLEKGRKSEEQVGVNSYHFYFSLAGPSSQGAIPVRFESKTTTWASRIQGQADHKAKSLNLIIYV